MANPPSIDVLYRLYSAKLAEELYRPHPFAIEAKAYRPTWRERIRGLVWRLRERVGFWIAGYTPGDDD